MDNQNPWYSATVAVRTAGDPTALVPSITAAITHVDKAIPVTRVRTMDDVAAESTARPRFRAQLVGTFAAVAVVLAGVGIFSVLTFMVHQRRREFGIRMALGAHAADVLRLVLGNGVKLIAIGLVIGVAAAALLTRWLTSLLFAVKPLDPIMFVAAVTVLASVALVACVGPALCAVRSDPAVALREE
jgi:putative ABC transport system permease protein